MAFEAVPVRNGHIDRCLLSLLNTMGAMRPKQISPVTASVHTMANLTSNDTDKSVAGAGGASSGAGIRGAISGVAPAGPGPPLDRQEDHALLA